MEKISGVVVLYNPNENVLENILTYLEKLEKLYVVDNTESFRRTNFEKKLEKYSNVEYIGLNDNLGIAKALNIGVQKCLNSDSEWLLTMDQDSRFKSGEWTKYLQKIDCEDSKNEIGIFSASHKIFAKTKKKNKDYYTKKVMTSGNIISKRVLKDVGEFNELFFIDEVDHEYCLRVIRAGYKIKVFSEIFLEHSLGDLNKNSRLPRVLVATNHNPLRRYYITRNKLYMVKKYKEVRVKYFLTFFNDFIKIIIFEKDRKNKLKMILRAYLDYKKGILGKYKK